MGKPKKGSGGRGAPRKFDWALIKKRIQENKTNREIAAEVGCTPEYVSDLRWKLDPGRRKYCRRLY